MLSPLCEGKSLFGKEKSMNRLWRPVAALLIFTGCAMAQAARTSTVVGTVEDPGGAIVVGAKVTLVNTETSIVSAGLTNAEGSYYIPFLPVGNYTLTVEAPGFKRFVQKGIDLGAAE